MHWLALCLIFLRDILHLLLWYAWPNRLVLDTNDVLCIYWWGRYSDGYCDVGSDCFRMGASGEGNLVPLLGVFVDLGSLFQMIGRLHRRLLVQPMNRSDCQCHKRKICQFLTLAMVCWVWHSCMVTPLSIRGVSLGHPDVWRSDGGSCQRYNVVASLACQSCVGSSMHSVMESSSNRFWGIFDCVWPRDYFSPES